MSARVESAPIRGLVAWPILVATLVALGVGALLGAVVTNAVNDRPSGLAPARTVVATPVASAGWDAQKLEAMEGRAMAEQFRDTVVGLSAQEMFALRQGVVPEQLQGEQSSAVGLTAQEMFALRQGVVPEQGSAVGLTAHEMFALRNGDSPQR